jgi:hypothetical protein
MSPVSPPVINRGQWRQVVWITLAAVALFALLRWLPTGTNLSHMDFRVEGKGANTIEFCDPLNPQFIPVVAARSPVALTLEGPPEAVQGQRWEGSVWLRTASGKPVLASDLLVTHTRRLHLLVVDPTLNDYQHLHPEPGPRPGEWRLAFTPRAGGRYRIFADFTPAATARGLYASVDLDVRLALPARFKVGRDPVLERRGVRFQLQPRSGEPLRAAEPLTLRFTAERTDGGAVMLEPVMGAMAHLVAFDAERSGFAHLHPVELDPAVKPDARRTELEFKLTIPRAGRYTIWAQVNLAGEEVFVPFDFEVR